MAKKVSIPKSKVQKAAEEEPVVAAIGEKVEAAKAAAKSKADAPYKSRVPKASKVSISHGSRTIVIPKKIWEPMKLVGGERFAFELDGENGFKCAKDLTPEAAED